MASKSIMQTQSVLGGDTYIYESPIIPNGSVWVIKKFGAAVPRLNDHYSANIILRIGTDIIRILTLCGNSSDVDINTEIIGDGIKKLNIIIQNQSIVEKTIAFWFDAYERS